jgi:hypothetical protein
MPNGEPYGLVTATIVTAGVNFCASVFGAC